MITKLITKRKQPLEDAVLYLTQSPNYTPLEYTPDRKHILAIIKMMESLDKRNKQEQVDHYAAPEYEQMWGKWAKFRKNWFNRDLNPLCSGTFEEVREENKTYFINKRTPQEIESDNRFSQHVRESNEKWKRERKSI